MRETISVIIPAYNAENTIIHALDSVKNQTGNFEFEIIVINDGSTDKTENLVQRFITENPEFNVILINQKNGGVSSARNAGLKITKGNFIALLDADDIWLPTKSEKQIAFFHKLGNSIDFISCRINNNKLLFPYFAKNHLAKVTLNRLLIRNGIPAPTVLFKRNIISKTGFFNDNQRYAEDHNYWLRISLDHEMYILDESLVIAGNGKRTFGISGLSANLKEMKSGFRKNLDELRALKKLNSSQYFLLRILYELKYYLLIFRSRF